MKTLNDIPHYASPRTKLSVTLNMGRSRTPIDIPVQDIAYDDSGDVPTLDFFIDNPSVGAYRLYLWSAYQFKDWEEAQGNGALYPLDHLDFDTLDFTKGVLADLVETLQAVSKCFGAACVRVVALPLAPIGAIEP